jgi:hypothetical protein
MPSQKPVRFMYGSIRSSAASNSPSATSIRANRTPFAGSAGAVWLKLVRACLASSPRPSSASNCARQYNNSIERGFAADSRSTNFNATSPGNRALMGLVTTVLTQFERSSSGHCGQAQNTFGNGLPRHRK